MTPFPFFVLHQQKLSICSCVTQEKEAEVGTVRSEASGPQADGGTLLDGVRLLTTLSPSSHPEERERKRTESLMNPAFPTDRAERLARAERSAVSFSRHAASQLGVGGCDGGMNERRGGEGGAESDGNSLCHTGDPNPPLLLWSHHLSCSKPGRTEVDLLPAPPSLLLLLFLSDVGLKRQTERGCQL
ncbi:hypothetical protein OJAV_G00183580 [Oryzias javanicus]|uniref:Uncharacterized protein n=1 Tax=Oryzias javanicus TaxID=123683 RepID=A0A437CDI5_ORYJA|nr:hypothetical protein OJAV_G00183580 [Oryzias javanicus]